MAVKSNLALIFKYFKLNIKKEAQYKTSFISQIVMMAVNDATFILQWVIIFGITESIGGYGFKEVMLLWSISAGSYGVAHLFFEGAFHIDEFVYNGKLDVFLTQPKNVLINVISSSCSISAMGDLIYAFIALIIAGAPWWWYLALPLISIIGGIIIVSVVVCFQTLSFCIKNGGAIANIVHSAINLFSTYPPAIYSIVAKVFLYTLIPCGFIVFIPAEYLFLGFNAWWLLGMLGFAVLTTVLAFVLFNLGLRRYNSGNLMSGRL